MSKFKASIILLVVFSVALAGSRVVSGSNQLTKPATKSNYTPAAVDFALNKAASRGRGLRTLSLNVERRGHTATALPDGRVLIAGGENGKGPVAEVEAIDSNSSRVDVVATLETARGGHTATMLQDGRVIIIGGSSVFGCQPPSGTTFAKGVTTVNCTATDTSQNAAAASFTVTVNDTEKPTVNAQTVLALAAPGTFSTTVNLNPNVTDNCPGVQVVLDPPSGSVFPAGSTLVTGTATDAAGNFSQFSFTVKVYNIIAVDDSTGGILRAVWNGGPSAQYEYYDCRKGLSITGTMSMTMSSCKIEGRDLGPDPKRPDRNVYILFNPCTFHASGWTEFDATRHNFTDLDVRNSPLACP